jgi:hypothetical protein
MNLEEKDIEIFKKLDSNVYLTFNDKQALKSGLDELDRRLQERERRFAGVFRGAVGKGWARAGA